MRVETDTMEEYHARDDVSSSKFKTAITQGYYAYKLLYVDRVYKMKQTPSMRRGSDFEDALCGRVELAFVPDGLKLNTKAGIAFKEENSGKLIVSPADRSFFTYGIDNIRKHPSAWSLIERSEEQVVFREKYEGLPGIQARPDWWCEKTRCAPDLKTCENLSRFKYSVEDFKYHVQAAFVRAASGHHDTKHPLIVSEKRFPHRCQVVWLDDDYVEAGTRIMHRGLRELARCFADDIWPLIEQDAITLHPPEKTMAELNTGVVNGADDFDLVFGSIDGSGAAADPN